MIAGPYRPRFGAGAADMAAISDLRQRCFPAADINALSDGFDKNCQHLMIEADGALVASCRLAFFQSGQDIGQSYAATFYELSRLMTYENPLLEIGRFCVEPAQKSPDILRLILAEITRIVLRDHVGLLFGCTSFTGTDPNKYRHAFHQLARNHLAPADWRPGEEASEVFRFAQNPGGEPIDQIAAFREMPALLRSYLGLGGWVSDHSVVDHKMQTLHVFTGVEVGNIPQLRARALRALIA